MQDNNLFGDDTAPSSSMPEITEISLRDITQAVDLTEFRKQNLEHKTHCHDLLLPVKETDVDIFNAAFDWTPPHPETTDLTSHCLVGDLFEQNLTEKRERMTENSEQVAFDLCSLNSSSVSNSRPFFDVESNLETISETEPLTDRDIECDSPLETDPCLTVQMKTPNGDLFSDEYKPKQRGLSCSSEPCEAETAADGEDTDDTGNSTERRISIPNTNMKDSRTFHPRKRQIVQGRGRDMTHSNFDVDRFSKEELLLMWKSSELELSERLEMAVKDKQRLESKLSALKLNMSTPV